MSVEAHERVWLEADTGEVWFIKPTQPSVEFVRADKLEELELHTRHADAYLQSAQGAIQRAEAAEAALAEAKRENEALREALKETRGNLKAGSTKAAVIKQIDTAIARNAGGKNA